MVGSIGSRSTSHVTYSCRRGIATTRGAAVPEACGADAVRRSEGLTRQRPDAYTTVAVF